MREMHPYDKGRQLVRVDFERFEQRLAQVVEQQKNYLNANEIDFYSKGKKFRPLLLLLCAHASTTEPIETLPEKVIAAATSIELVHVGSLIHDDIVDKAPTRRGVPTIAASRGYELALIIGDLQWVEATREMSAFMKTKEDIELMRRYLDTGRAVCQGQLDEMLAEDLNDLQALVSRYYRTIDRKTGQLVSFCCEGGARLMNASPRTLGSLKRFGTLLGRAFQVMDDVLDIVRPSAVAGKERLIDLRQGRLSLPIIYTLIDLPRDHFLQSLTTPAALSDEQLNEGMTIIEQSDGWMKAMSDARTIVAKAQANLALVPDSPYRTAISHIADHVVNQRFLDPFGNQPSTTTTKETDYE